MRYDENTRPSNTESGNSDRLVNLHGERIRYTADAGWHVYDGQVWRRDLNDVKIMGLAADIPGEIRAEAAQFPSIADDINKWAHASEKRTVKQNSVYLARSLPGIAVKPDAFDSDPRLFAVANGVVDLRTGEFREHRASDLISRISPVTYDPAAKCPQWLDFTSEAFSNSKETIESIQTMVGYWLTELNVEHKFWVCFGHGRNGKGVFLNTLRGVMGDYAGTSARDTFVHPRADGER